MALGPAIRRVLGPHLARHAGRCYRAIFADLTKEAAIIAAVVPQGGHLLDVGGGDGEPINHLLAVRPDLRITTLDPAPAVGQWIETRFARQVRCMPRTNLAEYLAASEPNPDVLLLLDVMHHVPVQVRSAFLASIKLLLERAPGLQIIVKDVEPGHWRARLGYWSDRYITGDQDVSPISRESLADLIEDALGPLNRWDTQLFALDRPNYAMVFSR